MDELGVTVKDMGWARAGGEGKGEGWGAGRERGDGEREEMRGTRGV